MKYIFIAYANERMTYSLKRIGRQAKRLGIFDEIILYSPDSLSESFKSIELMKHSYGGGYWAWKAWIIRETLLTHEEGDVVCYVDAGCTLYKSTEWNIYINIMKKYDALVFQYPDEMSMWERFGCTSTKIKHWGKKSAIEYYDSYTGGTEWRDCNKVLGGFLWFKGKNNPIVKDWYDLVVNHPEIIDDSGDNNDQFDFFCNHKHDQPAMTAMSYKHRDICMILPELLDEGPDNAAVVATRIRAHKWTDVAAWYVKGWIKSLLGERIIGKINELRSY